MNILCFVFVILLDLQQLRVAPGYNFQFLVSISILINVLFQVIVFHLHTLRIRSIICEYNLAACILMWVGVVYISQTYKQRNTTILF